MPRKKSETEKPHKSCAVKYENTPAVKIQKLPQCHIHDQVQDGWVDLIHENVCVKETDYPLTEHNDGEHYCLFHLPTKEKDIAEFEKIFQSRLSLVKEKVAGIEELPEEEHEKTKSEFSYDFRYVWFPSEVDLTNYEFQFGADFTSATFASYASFYNAVFLSYAYFTEATFSATAYFTEATFLANASFDKAVFASSASFSEATFLANANFISSTFSSNIDFIKVTFLYESSFTEATFLGETLFRHVLFSSGAFFSSAKFEETSQIIFNQTCFREIAEFNQALVRGYLYFEEGDGWFFDGEWLNDKKTKPKKVERLTSVFENSLSFAHVRTEKPEHIIFNRVRLRPSWFVNVDSRKFVFTDISWENYKAGKSELKEELKSLWDRNYHEPHNYQLLTVALRNLAANAEEFNRFEEASNFRKSAFECERLDRRNRQKKCVRKLKKEWSKNIICRQFFSEFRKSISTTWKLVKTTQFDFVHFLYRWLSGYGEKWFRAFCWLIFIWIFFAFLYAFSGTFGTEKEPVSIGFLKSIGYSLQVMILQKPEPRPLDWVTNLFYGFETIFAPLQAALLALAIRRKFMR